MDRFEKKIFLSSGFHFNSIRIGYWISEIHRVIKANNKSDCSIGKTIAIKKVYNNNVDF